jgi:hypothetical protein
MSAKKKSHDAMFFVNTASPAAACSVAGGFCYGRLMDESCIARESQNSPSPARASDRLLSIGTNEVLTSDRHTPVVGDTMA